MEAVVTGGGEDAKGTARVLAALTFVLERLVARNDKISAEATVLPWPEEEAGEEGRKPRRKGLEAFQGVWPPAISVRKYLERIQRYTQCSPSCFVVGFVYIDRAAHRHPGSLVVSLNVHRLILTSVLLASKVLDDTHHNNAFFARVGGVSNTELNRLELELLFLLDFGVAVSSRVFESYCWHLEKEMMCSRANQKIDKVITDHSEENGNAEKLTNGSPRSRSSSSPRPSIDW